MTTKKTTTKTKVDWDKVESVKPDTTKPEVTDSPETGVPFGSLSNIQQIIREYRKLFRTTPPEKNGVATSPTGNQYNYYMSGDVFDHVDDFCDSKGAMLELLQTGEDGVNVMRLTLEHMQSGEVRSVSATLGTPSSMADFGSRITYAPKYLIAIMFGISVQTDTDAFNNGAKKSFEVINPKTIEHEPKTSEGSVVNNDTSPSSSPSSDSGTIPITMGNTNQPSGTVSSVPVAPQGVASKSYELAKSFIEKSAVPAMLDEATVKINNSKNMSEAEKAELHAMINAKRMALA